MRMGCSARSAQGCDADACTTPAKWHNARVVRGGICTTAVENDCAHCCTPTEFLETLEFQRNEEWCARSLGTVYVQLLRLPTMRALYRRICTAGGDWALIGDVGMRLVAITVREKRLCEKWESHDMNGVPMKHDAQTPLGEPAPSFVWFAFDLRAVERACGEARCLLMTRLAFGPYDWGLASRARCLLAAVTGNHAMISSRPGSAHNVWKAPGMSVRW